MASKNWKEKLGKLKSDMNKTKREVHMYIIQQKTTAEYMRIAGRLFKTKARKCKYYINTKQGIVRV